VSAAPPQAVLFDLDGTLLDTAPDMAAALNALRAEEGLPPLGFSAIRPHVSHGAVRLIEVGFARPGPERFADLRQRFLDLYSRNLAVHTRLFDGLEAVLAALEQRAIPWGVVTNKPGWLTEPLLAELALATRSACIVSGDTLAERKPHPLPLLHAARLIGRDPAGCVYVGDAERDVQAGRAAGMRTVVAGFGYIGPGEDPASWHPDVVVASPPQLLDWLSLGEELPA